MSGNFQNKLIYFLGCLQKGEGTYCCYHYISLPALSTRIATTIHSNVLLSRLKMYTEYAIPNAIPTRSKQIYRFSTLVDDATLVESTRPSDKISFGRGIRVGRCGGGRWFIVLRFIITTTITVTTNVKSLTQITLVKKKKYNSRKMSND